MHFPRCYLCLIQFLLSLCQHKFIISYYSISYASPEFAVIKHIRALSNSCFVKILFHTLDIKHKQCSCIKACNSSAEPRQQPDGRGKAKLDHDQLQVYSALDMSYVVGSDQSFTYTARRFLNCMIVLSLIDLPMYEYLKLFQLLSNGGMLTSLFTTKVHRAPGYRAEQLFYFFFLFKYKCSFISRVDWKELLSSHECSSFCSHFP